MNQNTTRHKYVSNTHTIVRQQFYDLSKKRKRKRNKERKGGKRKKERQNINAANSYPSA